MDTDETGEPPAPGECRVRDGVVEVFNGSDWGPYTDDGELFNPSSVWKGDDK